MGCAAVRAAGFLPAREIYFRSRTTNSAVGTSRSSTNGVMSFERGVSAA